jgi:hypothetical protein
VEQRFLNQRTCGQVNPFLAANESHASLSGPRAIAAGAGVTVTGLVSMGGPNPLDEQWCECAATSVAIQTLVVHG